MSWSADYNPDNIIKDYTKPLSKVWDNLMPLSYPHILDFKTNKAVEVLVKRRMGPYSMDENFIDYDCNVIIDKTPLVENGWDGGPINKEMADKCYGELYFHELRAKMAELAKYAGLKFSSFDVGGILNAKTND